MSCKLNKTNTVVMVNSKHRKKKAFLNYTYFIMTLPTKVGSSMTVQTARCCISSLCIKNNTKIYSNAHL